MKSGSYCLVTALMVVGLFLTSSPASRADSMPHYTGNNSCSGNYLHMVDRTRTGTNPTFMVCVDGSNATFWKASLKNPTTLQIVDNCQLLYQQTPQPPSPTNSATFSCGGPPPGTIPSGTWLASITYWITGGGPITHAHLFYVAP